MSRRKERRRASHKEKKGKKYQEKPYFSDYKENRRRVCEVYGVDPQKAQVHHIVDRFTALSNPIFEGFDINQVSNLYPFTDDERGREQHTTKKDHADLHQTIGKRQWERRKRNGEW